MTLTVLNARFEFILTATSILRLTRSESSDRKSELDVFFVIFQAEILSFSFVVQALLAAI
jgi:hypothetical protein